MQLRRAVRADHGGIGVRRLLLTAVSLAAMTSALAGIPAEVTVDSGKLAGTTPDIRFDDAYQQLLKGGANQ